MCEVTKDPLLPHSSFFYLVVFICLAASLEHSYTRTFAGLRSGEISVLPLSVDHHIDLSESVGLVTVLY